MLKFESVAKIGESIKAFDFEPMPGRPDRYVIGPVVYKGEIHRPIHEGGPKVYVGDGYVIECAFDTEGYRIGERIVVPFEMSLTDFDNRVEVV